MISTDFPEDIFQPQTHKAAIYKYKINTGEKICKNKSILFCGICRNVGTVLERNLSCLHRMGALFQNYHIFLYENDSSDNTVDILNKYKSDKFSFTSTKRSDQNYAENLNNGIDTWHKQRCKVLAECRNNYLDFATQYYHFDYICIIDIDIIGGWSYDGIKHGIFNLDNNKDFGCVSSYGVLADPEKENNTLLEDVEYDQYMMYDSLAFRPLQINNIHMSRMPIFNKMIFYRGDDPIEVNSNFGGLAIYKMCTIKDKKYDTKEWAEGFTDPDHVIFNKQIQRDGYKIILDPSMISSYSRHRYSQ